MVAGLRNMKHARAIPIIDDMHPHFHCEGCGVTVCLDDTPVPLVSVPDGYEVYSVNYVIKGLCGVCASKYNG